MNKSTNRYNELSTIHRCAIDQLINTIASHQSDPDMDEQICNATYDAIKYIYVSYIQKGNC
jgi:hypothetical protein